MNFQVVTTYMKDDEVYLPENPSWMFEDCATRTYFEKFVKNLEQIEEEIKLRNEGLEIPYSVLQPSKIPTGVSI